METAYLEAEKSTTLRVRSSGSAFCINYQITKGRPCRSWQELVQMIGTSDSLHLCHWLFFSVCSISLTKYWQYASVVLSIYIYIYINYPAVYTLSERERVAAHMQGTVFP